MAILRNWENYLEFVLIEFDPNFTVLEYWAIFAIFVHFYFLPWDYFDDVGVYV
jgi:hypothetical protein